jgi:hypothetical protein
MERAADFGVVLYRVLIAEAAETVASTPRETEESAMSDTHAHTAKAQADVQTADAQGGKPHVPPGRVEAERPAVDRLGGQQTKPFVSWFTAGAVVLIAVIALLIAAT